MLRRRASVLLALSLVHAAVAAGEELRPARDGRCWEPVALPAVAAGHQHAEAPPPAAPAEFAMVADIGLAPKKKRWEEFVGGKDAAKLRIHARLAGWPSVLNVDRATLPATDEELLMRAARDTWRGLAAFTDRENGLPVDHVRFLGGIDPAQSEIGDYTTASAVGLYI